MQQLTKTRNLVVKRKIFIISTNSYSQEVEDLELESLDDMEMLKEFNDDIADEESDDEEE